MNLYNHYYMTCSFLKPRLQRFVTSWQWLWVCSVLQKFSSCIAWSVTWNISASTLTEVLRLLTSLCVQRIFLGNERVNNINVQRIFLCVFRHFLQWPCKLICIQRFLCTFRLLTLSLPRDKKILNDCDVNAQFEM